MPTTVPPTQLTTPPPLSLKEGSGKSRDGSDGDAAHGDDEGVEGEESGGGSMMYVVIVVVVVIVVIVAVFGIFIYVRQSKSENKNIKKKPKRSASRESIDSIKTVSSVTGKPLSKAKVAPKPVAKKK